jgi:hypothetical protein
VTYALSESSGGVVLAINNGLSPFTLALQPNGSLVGTGTVEVKGMLVTGQNDAGIIFTPVTAQCSIGTLAMAN